MYSTKQLADNSRDADEQWHVEPMLEIVGALQTQSAWTWRHLGRVARYAVAFAKKLDLDAHEMPSLQCASILHDIGKLIVPNELLDKSTPLTRDEWYTITKHSMASGQMIKAQLLPARVASIAQSHHEWFNGQGYPLGLEGEAIPLGARILSIADSYDAMSSDRPYRPALKPAEILAQFDKGAGTQFDPVLIKRLRPLLEMPIDELIPCRKMRVLSDDPMLFQVLWFAAYPLGWDIEVWPEAWSTYCPSELSSAPAEAATDLVIIDGRATRRLPDNLIAEVTVGNTPTLWIDPPTPMERALYRALDLQHLVPYFNEGSDWSLGRKRQLESIKVLIADPFKLFRQALVSCFNDRDDMELHGVVDMPDAYREAIRRGGIDAAVVASDMLEGTHTARRFPTGSSLIGRVEAGAGPFATVPTVVLVADEDMEKTDRPDLWEPGKPISGTRIYIPRGAPAETLIEAIKAVVTANHGK